MRLTQRLRGNGGEFQGIADSTVNDVPDVETLLRAIETLETRSQNPLSCFVSVWDSLIRELETTETARPGRLRELLVRGLTQIMWPDGTGNATYLTPLLEGASSDNPAVLFSLNYDNVVERAAAALGLTISCGLFGRYQAERGASVDAESTPVRLLKLHGSVNWSEHRFGKSPSNQGSPHRNPAIAKIADGEVLQSPLRRALVFGQTSKLTAAFPFFDLFLCLDERLRNATTALIVGYSGRDQHINTLFQRRFNNTNFQRVVIVDPGAIRVAQAMFPNLPDCNDLQSHPKLTLLHEGAKTGIPKVMQQLRDGSIS